MRIQYISDIHLEFHDKHNIGSIAPEIFLKPGYFTTAPYLALCGDIGIPDLPSYRVFLEWCSKNWKGVFVVAGNHEYYNVKCNPRTNMEQKKQLIRLACAQFPNVYFLDCDSVWLEAEQTRILGCTLWSEIDNEVIEDARLDMNDERQIMLDNNSPAHPEILREIHRIETDWLRSEIQKSELVGEKVVVLTHYLPSYQLIHEKYIGYKMNSCFASHCDDLIRPPVALWLCGHSHTGKTIEINGVPCSLNPHGYPWEAVSTRDRVAFIDV